MTPQEHYDLCIANGCSPALAEVLASRSFPGTRGTDRAFMQGRKLDGSQFDGGVPKMVGESYLATARRAGVNPAGRYYAGTLARFPGDPEAWVSGLDDVRRICQERGWGATGAVTIAPPRYCDGPHPLDKPYQVADDLVETYVDDAISANPDLAPKRTEVKEELAEKLAGR